MTLKAGFFPMLLVDVGCTGSISMERIRLEVQRRRAACAQANQIYVPRKHRNPYAYENLEAYEDDMPFDASADCRALDRLPRSLDAKGTYYRHATTEEACKVVGGVWSNDSINRFTKYDKGVCWRTSGDATCAAVVDAAPDLLRVEELGKLTSGVRARLVQSKKDACYAQGKCTWREVTNGYDCMPRQEQQGATNKLELPKEMPTSARADGFEEFLRRWYAGELQGVPKPRVLPSSGVGCDGRPVPKATNTNTNTDVTLLQGLDLDNMTFNRTLLSKMPDAQLVAMRFPRSELAKMDPWQAPDSKLLRMALGPLAFADYRRLARADRAFRLDWASTPIYSHKEDVVVVNLLPAKQAQSGKDGKEVSQERGTPSVAQSVVNVVMKNIARQGDASTARGLLAYHSTGSGKCFARGTPILMHDGRLKRVEEVEVGDQVMGDDGTPRNVLALGRGRDLMYRVQPAWGEPYVTNSEHILVLKDALDVFPGLFQMEVKRYVALQPSDRARLHGVRTGVEFERRALDAGDPYKLGRTCLELGHIPYAYRVNSRDVRLHVLAGVLDRAARWDNSIGSWIVTATHHGSRTSSNHTNSMYDHDHDNGNDSDDHSNHSSYSSNIYSPIVRDVLFLARSLGMPAYTVDACVVVIPATSSVPTRVLERLDDVQACVQTTVPINVVPLAEGEYVGFTVDGNHRFLLGDFTVTHNTCTATGVMDAFWDVPGRDIVFVSSIDALASNPPYKFHECAHRLYPRFAKMSVAQVAAAFEKRRVKYLSFAKLATRIVDPALKPRKGSAAAREGVDLDNAVLIVDEVHNLFRPLPHQKAQHRLVEQHLVDVLRHPRLRMVVLTATPGDSIQDTMKLINMVRDPVLQRDPIRPHRVGDKADLERFIADIRGLISYYDISADLARFPRLEDADPIRLPMGRKQFLRYKEAFDAIKKEWRDYERLAAKNQLGKWWVGARRYANMLYNFENGMSLTEFSSKLPALLHNLEQQHLAGEKAYVYSAFHEDRGSSHGVLEIARQLERMGWRKLTHAELQRGQLAPAKRYVLAMQKERRLDELIRAYNSEANLRGQLVSVMLATENFNEGLDLKAVRHVHVFEPLVTMAADLQTIGRARRYCSHMGLDRAKGEWSVKVWRYLSVLGDEAQAAATMQKKRQNNQKKKAVSNSVSEMDSIAADLNNKSIDELVFEEARSRYKQLWEVGFAMRQAAVDRLVTQAPQSKM